MSELSTEVKKKYIDLIKLGKDALDAIKAPFEARKAEKDLEKEVINIEQSIAEQELKIQTAKGEKPFNLKLILEAIDTKDLKERELKLAKELQKELF